MLPQVLILWQLIKAEEAGSDGGLAFWFLLLCASVLVSLWSLIALFVKRLHDLDLPPALCLLAVFSGINFFFFLFLAAMPSKQIKTRHGSPPFPR